MLDEPIDAPKPRPNALSIVLIVIVALLAITNVGTAYFLINKYFRQDFVREKAVTEALTTGEKKSEIQLSADEQAVLSAAVGKNEIAVQWRSFPSIEKYGFFNHSFWDESTWNESNFTVYEVGRVAAGPYQGNLLYVVTGVPDDGMNLREMMFRVVKVDDKLVVLSKHSDELPDSLRPVFSEDKDVSIANLEPPMEISIPDSSYKLRRAEGEPKLLIGDYYQLQKTFKYNADDYVYYSDRNSCYVVRAYDGTAREYYFDVAFLPGDRSSYGGAINSALPITWNDGSKNTTEYNTIGLGHCGGYGCYSYVPYKLSLDDLRVAGTTADDGAVYELKDPEKIFSETNSAPLRGLYEEYYPGFDEAKQESLAKISFEHFVVDKPMIFWQDPLGRWMVFQNVKYQIAAECGKPVIYLYPEKEQNVKVYVRPDGGFKFTEPRYDNGWLVKAKPNGELYNYADGQKYPYLFWEGFSYRFNQPHRGFVVAKREMRAFLDKTLPRLGLNGAETADFVEFWLPRMQSDPYYFITFLPQAEFDRMAPLTVIPQPDKVIRVFMDYQGLGKPIAVEEPRINTPKRTGFTVVEWGGVIHE